MKIINNLNAMKALKVFHILFGIMWIGGVMALVSIMLGVQPQSVEQMYAVAKDHLVIDKFFLIPGGIGIVLTALVYSIFTKWGFFKVKWVGVKWVLTVVLVLIGKIYMGVTIEKNMDYAAMMLTEPLPVEPFLTNVRYVAIAGIVQLVGFTAVLILSVWKPWTKSRKNLPIRTVIPLFAAIALHTTGKLIHLQGNEALFLVGALCFILGHICYLNVIIRGLGRLKAFQRTLLAGIPLVLCWMPAVALNINMPMATVSVFVMLAILLYVSCGIAGMLNKRREYVLILLGGICFLVSDAITGTGVTTPVGCAVSQVAFYIAEMFIISGILAHSRSDSAERDWSDSEI